MEMDNSTLIRIYQIIEAERLQNTICMECTKMKATLICEACNKPCCPLCIKSKLVTIRSGGFNDGSIKSSFIIKRCIKCHNIGNLPKVLI